MDDYNKRHESKTPTSYRSSFNEDRHDDMPPPSKRYKNGSPEFLKALQKGEIEISLPLSFLPRSNTETQFDYAAEEGEFAAPDEIEFPSHKHVEMEHPGARHWHPHAVVSDVSEDSSESAANYNQPSPKYCQPDPNLPLFSDIIGHGHAKLRIEEVLLPMSLPPSVTDSILTGVRSMPASILLFGPPGTGKTSLAKAVAGEAEAAFLSIGPGDILSKYIGESEAAVRALFKKACLQAHQMESKCAVIFLDEIDAIGQARGGSGGNGGGGEDSSARRVLVELLMQLDKISDPQSILSTSPNHMDYEDDQQDGDSEDQSQDRARLSAYEEEEKQGEIGAQVRVIVVAATNRPNDCDPALLRRFGIKIHVALPTTSDRKRILKKLLKDVAHNITTDEVYELAGTLEGWSGSDIENLAREATMAPVRECIRAAARQKRLARQIFSAQSQQQGSGFSEDFDGARGQRPGPQQQAKDCLLEGFQNLRPVTLSDFECAIEFWGGNMNSENNILNGDHSVQTPQHYDSSSDSEDENGELPAIQKESTRVYGRPVEELDLVVDGYGC